MSHLHPSRNAAEAPAPAAAPMFPDLTRDDVFRLETPRLWLRWQRHADVAALKAFTSLRPVAEMTGSWPHPLPEGEAERRIFEARKANATGAKLILAITPRARPNLQIGSIGVGPNPEGDKAEIGYMLHPEFWGQGLAAEAAQAVLNVVFSYTDVPAVHAWTRVVNPASRRVLEKCGFRHSGSALRDLPARGGMLPCDAFALDRKTWAVLVNWSGSAPGRALRRLESQDIALAVEMAAGGPLPNAQLGCA